MKLPDRISYLSVNDVTPDFKKKVTLEDIKKYYPGLGIKEHYQLYILKNPNDKETNEYYEYLIDKINKKEKNYIV